MLCTGGSGWDIKLRRSNLALPVPPLAKYVKSDIRLNRRDAESAREAGAVAARRNKNNLPFSFEARLEAGGFLGALQQGQVVAFPASRPMPQIGVRCHELRIKDYSKKEWRIIYRTDPDCVLVLDVFLKKTTKTPQNVIENCKKRLKRYDS